MQRLDDLNTPIDTLDLKGEPVFVAAHVNLLDTWSVASTRS